MITPDQPQQLAETHGTPLFEVASMPEFMAVYDGKPCYYIDDGVHHTFSGKIFDHCHYHQRSFKSGPTRICSVFGPTCDALDVISMAEELPYNLERGDLLYSKNIGAYSGASSTWFNGFPPAKVVHINRS